MRVSKPPQERRAELVAAARRLFDERGVAGTRVSDIVARVGVAQGVFYYYFGSKDEMVREVAQEAAREVQAAMTLVLQDTKADFCDKLARLIALILDVADQFLGDEETRLAPPPDDAAGSSPAAQSMRLLLEGLHTLILQGENSGQLNVEYPWETAQTVLYGLLRLAADALPSRRMIAAIAGQALGLPPGELARRLERACDHTAAEASNI